MMAHSYEMKVEVNLIKFPVEQDMKSINTARVNYRSAGKMSVIANWSYSPRNKHVAYIDFFFIRELVRNGKVKPHHEPTGGMPADVATKDLRNRLFRLIIQHIHDLSQHIHDLSR